MNGSPIETWEGAEAYFTFADSPVVVGIVLVLAIAVTVMVIASAVRHENDCYAKLDRKS